MQNASKLPGSTTSMPVEVNVAGFTKWKGHHKKKTSNHASAVEGLLTTH